MNTKYSIKIQADAQVLFKLLSLKEIENILNKNFPLNNYCTNTCKFNEIIISLSALPEFSLSVKPNKTEYKAQTKTLIYHENIALDYIKKANKEEIEVLFLEIFLQFLEESKNEHIDTDRLVTDIMNHFF